MLRISNDMIEDPGTKQKLSDKLAAVDASLADLATVHASTYKTSSNTWTNAIQSAINAVLGQTATLQLPAGTIKVDGIVFPSGTHILLCGMEVGLTVLVHNDGISGYLIEDQNNPNSQSAIPWGGFKNLTLQAGTLTTALIYLDGQIDNNMKFENLAFTGSKNTVVCDGISCSDYLNWGLNKVRFDQLSGYALKVRNGNSFYGCYMHMENFSYDNGTGMPSAWGKGLLYMDTSKQTTANIKGLVAFKHGRIECNQQLTSNELIRIVQYTGYKYQNNVSLGDVTAYLPGGNVSNFITTDQSNLLNISIKHCSLYGWKSIYNNDNKNAENAIYAHNYYNDFEVLVSKTGLSKDSGAPPYNMSRFFQVGNRRVFNESSIARMNAGYYRNGDIVFVEGKYAPFIAYQKSAIGIRSVSQFNFWQMSGTAGSNILTITDSNFNIYNNMAFIGIEIVIPGGGASGANLNAVIQDINFSGSSPTITISINLTTSVTNVMTTSSTTTLYQQPLFQFGTTPNVSNENNSSGDIVVNTDMTNGEYAGWLWKWDYTTGAYGFVPFGQTHVRTGVTTSRPTAIYPGYQYFDTTLSANGKPIWWTGSKWVDSTGTSV